MAEHLRPQCFCSGLNVWGCPHILTHAHKHIHIHWVAQESLEWLVSRSATSSRQPLRRRWPLATRRSAEWEPRKTNWKCPVGVQCWQDCRDLFMEAAGGIDTSHVWINAATHLWQSVLWATAKLLQSIFLQAICDQQSGFFDLLGPGQFVMQDQCTRLSNSVNVWYLFFFLHVCILFHSLPRHLTEFGYNLFSITSAFHHLWHLPCGAKTLRDEPEDETVKAGVGEAQWCFLAWPAAKSSLASRRWLLAGKGGKWQKKKICSFYFTEPLCFCENFDVMQ